MSALDSLQIKCLRSCMVKFTSGELNIAVIFYFGVCVSVCPCICTSMRASAVPESACPVQKWHVEILLGTNVNPDKNESCAQE